jgi:hypothetical protein
MGREWINCKLQHLGNKASFEKKQYSICCCVLIGMEAIQKVLRKEFL